MRINARDSMRQRSGSGAVPLVDRRANQASVHPGRAGGREDEARGHVTARKNALNRKEASNRPSSRPSHPKATSNGK